jgi:hypothetical protein
MLHGVSGKRVEVIMNVPAGRVTVIIEVPTTTELESTINKPTG